MKITPRDQNRFLAGTPFAQNTCIVLYGPNEGRTREVALQLKNSFVPKDDPFSYVSLSASDISNDPAKLADELGAGSLMGGQRLIHITESDDKVGRALKSALDAIPSPENRILLEAGNLTPRSTLRKMSETDDRIAILAFYEDTQASMSQLITQEIQNNNKTIDRDATIALQQYIGTNRQLALKMLEFLITYIGDHPSISLKDIQACFQGDSEQSIENVVRATITGNLEKLDRALLFLWSEGTSPIAIVRSVQSYLYRLRRAHSLLNDNMSIDRAMKSVKPPVFFKEETNFQNDLRQWPLKRIDNALKTLTSSEKDLKSTLYSDNIFLHRTLAMLSTIK